LFSVLVWSNWLGRRAPLQQGRRQRLPWPARRFGRVFAAAAFAGV